MFAQIVVVLDQPAPLEDMAIALRGAGHVVMAFADPLAAMPALASARVLVTRVNFAPGKPHGIALAQMAKVKNPGIKVLFTASSKYEAEAQELGEFLPLPVSMSDLVSTVGRLLGPVSQGAAPGLARALLATSSD